MGILESFFTFLGFGAACAKSSYDLNKQANSPEVQKGISEYRYLYDNPLPGRGFNYLLEFDVLHAKIREINNGLDQTLIERFCYLYATIDCASHMYGLPTFAEYLKGFLKEHPDAPFTPSEIVHVSKYSGNCMFYADYSGWFDLFKNIGYKNMQDLLVDNRKHIDLERNKDLAIRVVRTKWYKENFSQYVNADYSFEEYISEVARKTAYDNGYTPSCLNRKRGRLPGYACDYSGKYPPTGLAGFKIDWDKGIPDQLERARVMHYDKTKELLSREEMFVRLREKSLDSNNPIPENIENTCKNNVSEDHASNIQPNRISAIRRTWDNRPCENCWNKMCCKFSLIKNPTSGTEVKDEDAARFIGNVCMENQMLCK